MNEHKGFRISIGDDSEHEDLTAEIYFQENFLALISQEGGFQNLDIQIYQHPKSAAWSFRLTDFIETVELAKKRLWEVRRQGP